MIPDDHNLVSASFHWHPLKTYDNGSGPLWLYSESLGPVGIVRADTWEDAYEIAEDEFTAEADETVDELREEFGFRRERVKIIRDKSTGEGRPATLADYPLGEFQFVRWETIETPDAEAWQDNELFQDAYGFRPNGPNALDKHGHGIYRRDLNGERLERLTPEKLKDFGIVLQTEAWR